MFDYSLTTSNYMAKGALEIELRSREQGRKMAIVTAEYRKEILPSARRSKNPMKALFASLFSFL